LTGRLI